MGMRTVVVELPEELLVMLGSPDEAAARLKEAVVLDLLRRERLTQGEAAHLLDMSLWDFLPFMAQHRIETGPATSEELDRELDDMRRHFRAS